MYRPSARKSTSTSSDIDMACDSTLNVLERARERIPRRHERRAPAAAAIRSAATAMTLSRALGRLRVELHSRRN
jgi:hypothetical protein